MSVAIRRLPVSRGLGWFAAGWRGFAAAPGLLIGVMFLWLIIAVALSFIPLVGSLASTILWPALFGGYLLVGRAAVETGTASIDPFFAGLTRRECRADAFALGLLLLLGHVLAMIATTAAFFLFCLMVFGGIPWEMLADLRRGAAGEVTLNIGMFLVLSLTLLVALIPYTLIAMAVTYAAPLVLENRSTAIEALGHSFNACLRNILPLSIFALVYLVLAIIAAIPLGLGLVIFIPVSMAALARSYSEIFPPGETPDDEAIPVI